MELRGLVSTTEDVTITLMVEVTPLLNYYQTSTGPANRRVKRRISEVWMK